MPIYAYQCTSCGHKDEHLQKMSDTALTECPSCHAASYTKQVTAAGFKLTGTGWYATDFRGGSGGTSAPATQAAEAAPAPAAGGACAAGGCACH
ncbi:FmdB family zinc ribbon protein [Chitinolyticbacter meiyuanensis]|uniref:FmdB family zinc ribbon protein n=1 Tax=Chitinolyticbacter meiyuanensis TaxID=682798 RepID=UPI0011E5FABD|nr:FmdB family zinc ribbon protein [Chitinolyticbacter meiyuanensis]